MVNLLQFDRDALGDWCEQQGERPFRATHLLRWIH
jgi:adenine C2-methylase RlmN of 23S rRNA A2503 and tRNA A37